MNKSPRGTGYGIPYLSGSGLEDGSGEDANRKTNSSLFFLHNPAGDSVAPTEDFSPESELFSEIIRLAIDDAATQATDTELRWQTNLNRNAEDAIRFFFSPSSPLLYYLTPFKVSIEDVRDGLLFPDLNEFWDKEYIRWRSKIIQLRRDWYENSQQKGKKRW